MRGVVLLGLLDARLALLLVLDLPALLERVVGRGVVGTLPTQQGKRSEEQPAESAPSGTSAAQRTGEGIEASSVHSMVLSERGRSVQVRSLS
jgi:hypothetical protein